MTRIRRVLVVAALAAGAAVAAGGCGRSTPGAPAPGVRASSAVPLSSAADTLTVTSDAFTDGGAIPTRHTCRGDGTAPDVAWSGDTRGAAALAVVVDDPDAPSGDFVHWIVVDLPPSTTRLAAGAVPAGAHQAKNSAGRKGWTPPCPPSGTHHYRFSVYALGTPTRLPDGAPPQEALAAITARAVAQGRLVGTVAHGA